MLFFVQNLLTVFFYITYNCKTKDMILKEKTEIFLNYYCGQKHLSLQFRVWFGLLHDSFQQIVPIQNTQQIWKELFIDLCFLLKHNFTYLKYFKRSKHRIKLIILNLFVVNNITIQIITITWAVSKTVDNFFILYCFDTTLLNCVIFFRTKALALLVNS